MVLREIVSDIYGDDVSNSLVSDLILYWQNALIAFTYSPIVGLVPSSYSGAIPFGKEDAHNSYIDWIVSTGSIGIISISILFISKLKISLKKIENEFLAISVSMLVFSIFHRNFRNFLFSIVILFFEIMK
jgi:O-antigen ligase